MIFIYKLIVLSLKENFIIGNDMETLTRDVNMLMSVINMKLRNEESTLDEYCHRNDIDKDWLIRKLETGGFEYSPNQNKF